MLCVLKTCMKTTVFLGLIILGSAQGHAASLNPPFAATCQDVLAHAYRDGTDLLGTPMGESWSTDEHFNAVWKFVYKKSGQITIDDKKGVILAQHPGVLIVTEVGVTNGIGASVWTYAIHLGMKKIVGAQVHAHGSFDGTNMQGVKTRSVNLNCKFAFNTSQPPPIASNREDIIRQAQRRLKTVGFDPGPETGTMNPRTIEALRSFKLAHGGLPVDGELDEATREALMVE